MSNHFAERDHVNAPRWPVDGGHYESWFIRANHPDRPLAFWIRYTIYSPAGMAPDAAEGELWAVWFDGETQTVSAAYGALPIADCSFEDGGLKVAIGSATLDDASAQGAADGLGHSIRWQLALEGGSSPLLLFPERFYDGHFPKAKTLVPRPLTRFTGHVEIDGTSREVSDWVGSQNHNWGSAHTDRYAWAQVPGFDSDKDAFLECSSARVRVGPVLTPWLTLAVIRVGDEEIRFDQPLRSPLGHVRLGGDRWTFRTSNGRDRLRVTVQGADSRFVDLTYRNPAGGTKLCRNTKLAACEVLVTRRNGESIRLRTRNRGAFEVLT